MTTFSEQLKSLRSAKNISQEVLAQELFISRQAISKWENGEATPDLDNLVKLAEIFQVSLDQLILGKEPEKIIERVIEKDGNRPMNIWEFCDKNRGLVIIICFLIFLSIGALAGALGALGDR